jgi:hypothetical protein
MVVELSILGGSGDIKITWDKNDPVSVARAREEVRRLKTAGYLFFLVDDSPADEVTAGNGELVARIVSEDEIVPPESEPLETGPAADPEPPKKRGRRSKALKAIAVPPLRGG